MSEELFSLLFCCLILFYKTEAVSSLSQPRSIEYAECGADLDLKWVYDKTKIIDSITWFSIGNTELKIASYVPNLGFSIIKNAKYLPIQESRFMYIFGEGSAGVKIKGVKLADESQIKVVIDFIDLQSLQYVTAIKVIVSPVPTETRLPAFSFAELEASSVEFVCTFKSLPEPKITWFGNGKQFEFNNIKSVMANSPKGYSLCNSSQIESSLVLMNINLGDSQNISCSTSILAYDKITSVQSTIFQVGYKPGKLLPSSLKFSDASVSGGSYSTLTCKADAIPLPTFEVYRDSYFLVSGSADYTGSFVYTVGPVKFYDDGIYTCKITNKYGTENLTVVLNVTVVPQFWGDNLSDITISLGDSLNIPCRIYGDPLLQNSMWMKLNGPKTVFDQKITEVLSNKTVSFRINNLYIEKTVINDSGVYQCIGYNFLGNVTVAVNVQLIFSPQLAATNLANAVLSSDNSIYTYYCIVIGFPKPTIKWSVKNKLLATTNQTLLEEFLYNYWKITSTIKISLSWDFFGELQCDSINGFDRNISVKAVLKFPYKPFVNLTSNVSTIIIDGLPAVSVSMDTSLQLTCIVQGYDLMTVKWYRDNITISNQVDFGPVINSSDLGYIQSSSLLIRLSLDENFKVYKCVSNTSAGETESILKIYVLYGGITKPLGGVICFKFQTDAFLDWQIFYSQPISTVKWAMLNEDGSEKFIIGKLTNRNVISASMKSSHYDYDTTTVLGLYIKNVSFDDEGWYSVSIDFINSPYLMEAKAYLCVTMPPSVTVNNEIQYANVSDKVELTCQSYGDSSIQLYWLMPSFSTNSSLENKTIYQNISFAIKITSVKIQSVEIRHSGIYGCVANSSFYSVTKNITLNVRSDVLIINSSLDQPMKIILANSRVVRYCTVIAAPKVLKIEWFLNGVPISSQNLTNVVLEDGFYHNIIESLLTYNSVQKTDAGNLSCIATNELSKNFMSSIIIVQYSPETFLSANLTIKERESANFSCLSEGQPIPVLKWLLNNKTVFTNNEKVNIATNSISNVFSGTVSSNLSMVNASRNDSGEITCVADNPVNSVAKITNLNVQYPPDWKAVYNPVYVVFKRLMVLDCYVNANPPASYNWFINGTPIDNNASTYVVDSANFNNEGNYTCLPSNYLGSPGIILFTVFMLVPPENINVNCESTDPVYGDRVVTCNCTGNGRPAPEFFWTRKSDLTNTILSSSQVLIISVPYTDSDVFVCHMKNIAGTLSSLQPSAGYSVSNKSYGYLLYILIPLFIIGAVILTFLICKNKSKSSDNAILVPVNRNFVHPPSSFISGPNKKSPIINSGYIEQKEIESVEISINFGDENNLENNFSALKTESIQKKNLKHKPPVDFDLRCLENVDY
ncbi:hemicentin-1 isoform X1 [Hydra vulgaris]|nr:hemicentin-1 isoform X2 [Hydra vulgaris]XP_047130419.1 hemicentin-1 isoform X2 [Hydra vulgaris]